jgi:hypothetical protein
MTVTRAPTTRPLVRDVRPARGRRRVCDVGSQAVLTGIGAMMIPVDHAWRGNGSPNVTRHASRQRRAANAPLAARSFKLQ